MSEATVLPNPVLPAERKCKIEEVFEPGFIELMQLVPLNSFVRALILKLTGKMPDAKCDSFEQLKDWTELNCEKRARSTAGRSGQRVLSGGIRINVEFSETEYGRASYSVARSGSDEFQINAGDLMEIVRDAIEAGEGIGEIVEVIAGRINDDAWNQCDPSMDDYGDYNYDEHDSTGSEDSGTTYSRDEIRNAVLAFIRERHPELAAEL